MIEIRKTAVFGRWLDTLHDDRAKAKIAQRLVRVQSGLVGDVKPVGGNVSELRIDYGPGYRLYFTRRDGAVVILLCGGDKRTQKADIRKAQELAASL